MIPEGSVHCNAVSSVLWTPHESIADSGSTLLRNAPENLSREK